MFDTENGVKSGVKSVTVGGRVIIDSSCIIWNAAAYNYCSKSWSQATS